MDRVVLQSKENNSLVSTEFPIIRAGLIVDLKNVMKTSYSRQNS